MSRAAVASPASTHIKQAKQANEKEVPYKFCASSVWVPSLQMKQVELGVKLTWVDTTSWSSMMTLWNVVRTNKAARN